MFTSRRPPMLNMDQINYTWTDPSSGYTHLINYTPPIFKRTTLWLFEDFERDKFNATPGRKIYPTQSSLYVTRRYIDSNDIRYMELPKSV